MHAFLAPAELAYAFLARVLRTAAPSLAGVLSGTRPASLRSYSEGSYHTYFTVDAVGATGDRGLSIAQLAGRARPSKRATTETQCTAAAPL